MELKIRDIAKYVLMGIWLIASSHSTFATSNSLSNTPGNSPTDSLKIYQDSLQALGKKIYNEPAESNRLSANFQFVRTLVQALKIKNSFAFPFESLDMISVLKSPDENFRIFSWHVPLSDGSFLYYGSIQFNTEDGNLKLLPLLDKTFEISQVEEAITTNENWYGAQYYEIVPFEGKYILLGWKGHTPEVSQKVIEILNIDQNNQITLGSKDFSGQNLENKARIIFSFSQMVSMYLKYHPNQKQIVFDNLNPSDPNQVGNFKFYGPDFTFNSLSIQNGKLTWVGNINFEDP